MPGLTSPGVEQTRIHNLPAASTILDCFQSHDHNDIDTARVYGGGSSGERWAISTFKSAVWGWERNTTLVRTSPRRNSLSLRGGPTKVPSRELSGVAVQEIGSLVSPRSGPQHAV
jgi:hypothetical protein